MKFLAVVTPPSIYQFSRFMLGEKRSMGVVIRQDEALTIDQILLISDISENDWLNSNSEKEKKELNSEIEFSKIAFCVSTQGDKVPLILIKGLNMFWRETWNHRTPYMMMTTKGRFNGEKNLRCNCVLLAD